MAIWLSSEGHLTSVYCISVSYRRSQTLLLMLNERKQRSLWLLKLPRPRERRKWTRLELGSVILIPWLTIMSNFTLSRMTRLADVTSLVGILHIVENLFSLASRGVWEPGSHEKKAKHALSVGKTEKLRLELFARYVRLNCDSAVNTAQRFTANAVNLAPPHNPNVVNQLPNQGR